MAHGGFHGGDRFGADKTVGYKKPTGGVNGCSKKKPSQYK